MSAKNYQIYGITNLNFQIENWGIMELNIAMEIFL